MNRIISGKWTWIDDHQTFRVVFVTPQGKVGRADSRTSFSRDVNEAVTWAAGRLK